jgi:phage terminase large subunit-like protein
MGRRGPGASKLRLAREALPARKRRLPWKRAGLTRAQRVLRFLSFLPITKGPLAGRRLKLLPEQREFIEEVYGRVRPDGLRQRRLAIGSQPKGGGKSAIVAGLCLCHLVGPEAEPRGEVYSAAIDRQQAGIIFAEMEAIIFTVPEFASRINVQRFHKRMEVLEGDGAGSTYEALSSDARRAHGLSPTLFAYDELAQAKDRELLDNLINGLGKRREALGIIISTQAPNDTHPLSQLIDDALLGADPSTYVQLIAAPVDADPFDEKTWFACNPALGKFLSLPEMRQAAQRARRIPAFEPSFRNLRLNQRVDASEEARLVTAPVWKVGNVPIDREALRGRVCFAALDLSGKHDLTALVLVFPDDKAEPVYDILPIFWTPAGQLSTRTPVEQQLFKQWIAAGFLNSVPGPTIRFSYIAAELVRLSKEFKIEAVGFDRWRIDDFQQDLDDVDANFPVPLEPFGQGYQSMGPAVELFAELALTSRLRHGGHPVLTAAVSNAITVSDPAGNLKLDKPKSNKRGPVRIDGAVALVMALQLAKKFVPKRPVDLAPFLNSPVLV